jgi:hypothetical protein
LRKLLSILFLLVSLQVSAQDAIFRISKDTWKINAAYTTAIILNAVGDGLNDSHHKGWGHMANACSITTMLSIPLWNDINKKKWYAYIIKYAGFRVAYFDWTYNKTRGLPLTYYGSTSFWDKNFMNKLKPPDGFALGRIVSFSIALTIPID